MGARLKAGVVGVVCCVLLTACPPEEVTEYPIGGSLELNDRLGERGYDLGDVQALVEHPRLGLRTFGRLTGGAVVSDSGVEVVDDCVGIVLVLEPTGERIDDFGGPVCWEDKDTRFQVELEMTTLADS